MRSVLRIGLILTIAFAVVGCPKPPTQEMDAAKAAILKARNAEADVYAPETFRQATSALADAENKVTAEDYEGAKASALRATELAVRSTTEADTGKNQTRNEAQAIINRISSGLTDARSALNAAPRGKGADEDLDQLNSDLGQAEGSLNDARNNLSASKFKDALTQARSADT